MCLICERGSNSWTQTRTASWARATSGQRTTSWGECVQRRSWTRCSQTHPARSTSPPCLPCSASAWAEVYATQARNRIGYHLFTRPSVDHPNLILSRSYRSKIQTGSYMLLILSKRIYAFNDEKYNRKIYICCRSHQGLTMTTLSSLLSSPSTRVTGPSTPKSQFVLFHI